MSARILGGGVFKKHLKREEAIKQLKEAKELGYNTINEYFMKNGQYRTTKTAHGYDENTIEQLANLLLFRLKT